MDKRQANSILGLDEAARALLDEACCVCPNETVALLYDDASDTQVLHSFVRVLSLTDHAALVWDSSVYWEDPSKCEIPASNLMIDIAGRYLLHTKTLRGALLEDTRYACFPHLTPEFLCSTVVNSDNYRWLMSLGRWAAGRLERGHSFRFFSEEGTRLECVIEDIIIDDAGKPARRAGDVTYLTGQVSLYPRPNSLSGTVAVNGIISPIGRLTTPVILKLEAGIVQDIHGDDDLMGWLDGNNDCALVRNMAHLSIGLIPGLGLSDRAVLSERIFGALVLGFGSQPPGLGIFPDLPVKTSINWNTITTDLLMSIDGLTIIDKGNAVDDVLRSRITDRKHSPIVGN